MTIFKVRKLMVQYIDAKPKRKRKEKRKGFTNSKWNE